MRISGIAFLVFIAIARVGGQSLFINEFMASNASTMQDDKGEFEDWVEIYNASGTAIDLGGMYFTDDLTQPDKWQIPQDRPDSTTIGAGEFLIFWFDKDPEEGVLHVNCKLSSSGEQIGLFDSTLQPVDTLSFGAQNTDVSYGRNPDGGGSWLFFANPTPGTSNGAGLPQADPPVFSQSGGFYSTGLSLSIFNATSGTQIHYTTDGSTPTDSSALYQTPINVDSSMVVKAIVTGADYLSSPVQSAYFVIGSSSTLPVVFLSFDPVVFYDSVAGIYTHWDEDLEAPVDIAFFEPNGTLAFEQPAKAQIHGSASAEYPHKSLSLKAKKYNGKKKFQYPIFPQGPFDEYGSLLLRNSGQDWDKTLFRDVFATGLMMDLSDLDSIIEPPKLTLQSYRPAIAYFNGDYRGIYNIRERFDSRYIKQHYGLSKDEYDFMKNLDEVKSGTWDSWFEFQNFILDNDMSIPSNFDSLQKLMATDEYMDYVIFNIYLDNMDWPANNNRRWKAKSPDGKWRWMTYDLDLSLGLINDAGLWNTGDYTDNALLRLFNDQGWDWPNPEWATRPFRACVSNAGWRTDFINRMADQLNVLFGAERMNSRLDELTAIYQPEIDKHSCRWFECALQWEKSIDTVRYFISGRRGAVRSNFVEQFAEITDTTELTVQVIPAGAGKIRLNTLTLNDEHLPWQGVYFAGVDIPVQAIAEDGYEFDRWGDTTLASTPDIALNLDGGQYTLTAIFKTIVNTAEADKDKAISLYPNPAHNHITLLPAMPDATITVTNALGQVVQVPSGSKGSDRRRVLDISRLPQGLYFVTLNGKDGPQYGRFVKE